MCLCVTYANQNQQRVIYGERKELASAIKKIGKGHNLIISLAREDPEDVTSPLIGFLVFATER